MTVMAGFSHRKRMDAPTGNGDIGLCRFDDDHNPSFRVNDKSNYWNCWTGCSGGSVVDFWIKWRGVILLLP